MTLHEGDIDVVPESDDETGLIEFDGAEVEVLDADDGDDESDNEVIPTDEGKRIRKRIKILAEKLSDNYWEISELIARVHNEKIFRQWGYKKFSEWANGEFSVGRSKAYNFAKIQNYFNNTLRKELPEPMYNQAIETARKIGWNKALEVARANVITKDNCAQVLEVASTRSYDDLKKELKVIFKEMPKDDQDSSVENNTMKTCRKTFVLTVQQEVDVKASIEKAKESMREGATDSSALALICAEYLSCNPEGSLSEKLSNFERLLGVQLVAVSQDGVVIEYGEQTLKTLAEPKQ